MYINSIFDCFRDMDISYEKTVVKGNNLLLSGILAKGIISEKGVRGSMTRYVL
jgi:hypothetical protein